MSRPIAPLRAFSTSLRTSAPSNPFASPFSNASSSSSASKAEGSKSDTTPSSVDIKALAARMSFMPDTEKDWRKHFHARKVSLVTSCLVAVAVLGLESLVESR